MGLRALIALLICCTVTLGDDSWTPVAIDVWDSNCDESQVQVASPYTCDEANPNDVTLSYAATDTWHDGGGRSFWVETHKACYREANKTCERHGGTLVHLDNITLSWMANSLWNGAYLIWTDYRAIDKGFVDYDHTRTCTFRPARGPGPEIKVAMDMCLYCECVLALVNVRDGVLTHRYTEKQCNRPVSVVCQKSYNS